MTSPEDFVIQNGVLVSYKGYGGIVTVPDGVRTIGKEAFFGCKGLECVILPESVTSLDWETFSGCTALEQVRLPSHLTQLPRRLFSACENLTDLQADGVPPAKFPDSLCKRAAAVNFARRVMAGEVFSDSRRAEWTKYIRNQKKKLYPLAMQNPPLLQFMEAERIEVPNEGGSI